MDIKEVRNRLEEIETIIAGMLEDFTDQTGLVIRQDIECLRSSCAPSNINGFEPKDYYRIKILVNI